MAADTHTVLGGQLPPPEVRQVRDWIADRIVEAGVGPEAAYALARVGADYRVAVHLKELGMNDEQILDQLID